MKKNKTSKNWLRKQHKDHFVVKSKIQGYRSRSAFKLIEMDNKFKFLKKSKIVIDLGAAPGGWSQVAAKIIGLPKTGKLVAVDIQDIVPIEGLSFINGSIMDEEIIEMIKKKLECQADVVLSDMAPSASGHRNTDQTRALLLAELALDTATRLLKKEGSFCCKLIRGKGEEELVSVMRRYFSSIKRYKPESSRKDSAEIFLIGLNFNDQNLA